LHIPHLLFPVIAAPARIASQSDAGGAITAGRAGYAIDRPKWKSDDDGVTVQQAQKALEIIDLGRKPYGEALRIQEERVGQCHDGKVPDALFLVEHDPVYTLGRNASQAEVLLSEAECRAKGVEVIRTTRGGKVTFHGPGQLVGYPIIRLGTNAREAVRYVGMLEDVLVRVLDEFGLKATGDKHNRGVWVGNEKIAALGVRITGGVTMHGFALNVRVDLSFYGGIVPCGIKDRGVTSMHRSVQDISVDKVKPVVVRQFREVFRYGQ